MTRKQHIGILYAILFATLQLLAGCREQTPRITSELIPVDAHWDNRADTAFIARLSPYKTQVDSLKAIVVGRSAQAMDRQRPEDLLSNWSADMIKYEVEQRLGRPVDFGLLNVGGIRTTLPQGNVTIGNILSIFPFDNRLSAITLKGSDVRALFEIVAARGGEAVSREVRLKFSDAGITALTINGKPVDDNREYTIATIDYLANGGDKLTPFKNSVARTDFPEVMREAIIGHFRQLTRQGKQANARIEGRVVKE